MLEKTQKFSRAESTVKFDFGKTAVSNKKATASQLWKNHYLYLLLSLYIFLQASVYMIQHIEKARALLPVKKPFFGRISLLQRECLHGILSSDK